MTKNSYLDLLGQLLREHYDIFKDTGIASPDRQHFIDGYLAAARALDVIDYDELKDYVEKVHYGIFNMTIDERRKKLKIKQDIPDDYIDIPAYKRQGIKLEF